MPDPKLELPTYQTSLAPDEEADFMAWAKHHSVPLTPDYDMRGYYRAMKTGQAEMPAVSNYDGALHFPDTWKTPQHESFSSESVYAKPGAPQWMGEQLIDPATGAILVDERTYSRNRSETGPDISLPPEPKK